MWTLCSIGSNIEPINNTALALTRWRGYLVKFRLSPLVRLVRGGHRPAGFFKRLYSL